MRGLDRANATRAIGQAGVDDRVSPQSHPGRQPTSVEHALGLFYVTMSHRSPSLACKYTSLLARQRTSSTQASALMIVCVHRRQHRWPCSLTGHSPAQRHHGCRTGEHRTNARRARGDGGLARRAATHRHQPRLRSLAGRHVQRLVPAHVRLAIQA